MGLRRLRLPLARWNREQKRQIIIIIIIIIDRLS